MSTANKAILLVLVLVLIVYLGILGLTLLRTQRNRQPPVSAESPQVDPVLEELLEDDLEDIPADTQGRLTPAEDAERFEQLIRQLKRADDVLAQAERQAERGQVDQAIAALEDVLTATPNVLEIHLTLADLYIRQNDLAKARDTLYHVLSMDPQREGVRLRLARTLHGLRHHQAALHMALWILEADTYQEEPNQIAALSYMGLEQTERAIPHFRRQVAINRDNIVAQNNLAVAYSRLGDFGRAVTLFRDVLAADPSNAVTYYNLAVSQAKQGHAEEAVDALNEAADRFGLTFVSSWLRSRDFDGVRDNPAFMALQRAVDAEDELF